MEVVRWKEVKSRFSRNHGTTRQGRAVYGLGESSMNLAWDFLSGPVLPVNWRKQSSKGLETRDASMWYVHEELGK